MQAIESLKAIQTKNTIKDAYIDCLHHKSADSLSVKEIMDRAGYSRGTFYVYYNGINYLLEEIEEDLIQGISIFVDRFMPYNVSSHDFCKPIPMFLQLLEYHSEHREYFNTLLGKNGDPSFFYKVKNFWKESMSKKLKFSSCRQSNLSDYMLEYLVTANIRLVVYWMEIGIEISSEEIAIFMGKILYDCSFTNATQFLMQNESLYSVKPECLIWRSTSL